MLLGTIICVMGLFLMTGVMETINLFYGASIAQTRADLIADGAAVYGMSYDNTLDQGKVALMSSLLLASSANYDNPILMRIDYSALQNNQVRVQVTSQRNLWFPKAENKDTFRVTREAVSEADNKQLILRCENEGYWQKSGTPSFY